MIRCRQCNSELTVQARFCNVCGLRQEPRESKQENSTRNGEKALATNITNHCENCATELPKEARFCAVCGTAQTTKKSAVPAATSNEPITPTSTTQNNESSTVHLRPSVSVKSARTLKTVNKQQSKASEKTSIRPKTVVRPPVFPSRPTSNGTKPSNSIQLPDTLVSASSSEPALATTQINQSSPEKMLDEDAPTGQSTNVDSAVGEHIADISIQTPEELSTPARTPG